VPALLREIVLAQKGVRFDRAHFKGFGDSALLLEVVYYVLDRDYNVYMDAQQAINLEIRPAFPRRRHSSSPTRRAPSSCARNRRWPHPGSAARSSSEDERV
jgi:hypothetical protein